MKDLMIHVEKAVRPLRITQGQRQAIREEMLGHLQGIYEDELERHGDTERATRAAIERFGAAEDVSRHLASSLPWYSSLLACVPWFARVRSWPESFWRVGWRAWMTAVLLWVLIGVPFSCLQVIREKMALPQAALWWLLMAMLGVAMLLPFVGMIGAMHGTFGLRRSRLRSLFFALVGCASQLSIFWLINTYVKPDLSRFVYLIPFGMSLGLWGLLHTRQVSLLVQDDCERDARAGEWEQLSLDTSMVEHP